MKTSTKSILLTMTLAVTTCGTAALADNNVRNGLPPTRLDSFVAEAYSFNREVAEKIYGDEGLHGAPPPYKGFTEAHRINRGIAGVSNQGLTTGHGSYLPDATGGDEFIGKPEFSQSGTNNGAYTEYQEPQTLPADVVLTRQARALGYFDLSSFQN